MLEQNEAIVRRVAEEGYAGGNLDVIDECVAEDFVGHDPADPDDTRGREALKQRIGEYRRAFPDLDVTIEHCFGEGDLVCTRWIARGTHEGELMGIEPTHKPVEMQGISIDRFEDGAIAETWDNWDTLGLMQQLGVAAQPQAA